MNIQSTTSEIASKALATLAEALEAGKSKALTAYLKSSPVSENTVGPIACLSRCSAQPLLTLRAFGHGSA